MENLAATSAHEGTVPEVASPWEDHVIESPEDGKCENDDGGECVGEPVELTDNVRIKSAGWSVDYEYEPCADGKAKEPSKDHVPIMFLAWRCGLFREMGLRSSSSL